jgi:hypothetical protein
LSCAVKSLDLRTNFSSIMNPLAPSCDCCMPTASSGPHRANLLPCFRACSFCVVFGLQEVISASRVQSGAIFGCWVFILLRCVGASADQFCAELACGADSSLRLHPLPRCKSAGPDFGMSFCVQGLCFFLVKYVLLRVDFARRPRLWPLCFHTRPRIQCGPDSGLSLACCASLHLRCV